MTSRALVVGCDAYPREPDADLRGSVADALAFREWLLDPAGGRLSPDDVDLLLSPSADGAQPPEGLVHRQATSDELARSVAALSGAGAGPDDRLFVFLAGHGCQTDPFNASLSEDVVVLSDFSTARPSIGAVSVAELDRSLRRLPFGDFFLFADACRNLPFDRPFRPAALDFELAQGRPQPARSHVFLATSPGGVAHGTETDGIVRGDFTQALLAGLAGEGEAKWFNPIGPEPCYEVTWERLRRFVEQRLEARLSAPAEADAVLSRFEDGWFADIELSVELEHELDVVAWDVQVEYDNFIDPAAGRLALPGPFPSTQLVPPRRHRVIGRIADRWAQQVVDAYTNTVVRLVPVARPLRVPGYGDSLLNGFGDTGASERVTRAGLRRRTVVRVRSTDPLTVVELTDLGGRRMASGVGELVCEVGAGSYQAWVRRPGLPGHAEPVEVGALGADVEIDVPARVEHLSPPPPCTLPAGTVGLTMEQPEHAPAWALEPAEPPALDDVSAHRRSRTFAASPQHVLDTNGRHVIVPLIPGVRTAVAAPEDAPLVVRLVDEALVGTTSAELLVLAQDFAEQRAWGPAVVVLDALTGTTSAVAEVLRTLVPAGPPQGRSGDQTAAQPRLADWLSDRADAEVLAGQLWNVRVDDVG